MVRRGPSNAERFATDLFSCSAVNTVLVSSPCLLYSVVLTTTAAAISVNAVLADAVASAATPALTLAVASGAGTGGSAQLVFNPPIVMTAGIHVTGSNLGAASRVSVQAYVIS